MPASSRKRNKGRDRKAKQQAKKKENYAKLWRSWVKDAECNHGCDMIISDDDHPVSSFMDQFYFHLSQKEMKAFDVVVSETLRELFVTHRHIWNNESYRKLVIDVLVCIGTNEMLHEARGKEINMSWPICLAHCTVILEHYEGPGSINVAFNCGGSISKRRDLMPSSTSSRRDLLKFYRKRTTCKCLKKTHLEARKNKPKMGLCWYCDKDMERVLLSLCSRCMVSQYCSRECQVADWPKHESVCDQFVRQREMNDEEKSFG